MHLLHTFAYFALFMCSRPKHGNNKQYALMCVLLSNVCRAFILRPNITQHRLYCFSIERENSDPVIISMICSIRFTDHFYKSIKKRKFFIWRGSNNIVNFDNDNIFTYCNTSPYLQEYSSRKFF
jgi:hypothetical protein